MQHAKKRKFRRANIAIPINIQTFSSAEFGTATAVDISGSGISVVLDGPPSDALLQEGSFLLQFEIPGANQPALSVEIVADVVCRDDWPFPENQQYRMAFQFDAARLDHNVQQELVAFILRQPVHQREVRHQNQETPRQEAPRPQPSENTRQKKSVYFHSLPTSHPLARLHRLLDRMRSTANR
ncbi:MAG: PilZ domain-containing protein [Candidatus Poribacteria bacterium]|nr:PilZ domain-containing protein [Candidatus Poribacteria bacterium]